MWSTRSRLRLSFPQRYAIVGVTSILRSHFRLKLPLKPFSKNIIKLSKTSTSPSQERWFWNIGSSSFQKGSLPLIRLPIGSTCVTSSRAGCLIRFNSGYFSRATLRAKAWRRKSSINFSSRIRIVSKDSDIKKELISRSKWDPSPQGPTRTISTRPSCLRAWRMTSWSLRP